MTRIGVIDYGMGNRRAVEKALAHVGADPVLTSNAYALRACDGLVLPGVGAFPQGIANLRELGHDTLIQAQVARSVPLLGICLGMQLLFDASEEMGGATGLGLIPGQVTRLDAGGRRIPHIGWNKVRLERRSPLTDELPGGGRPFYHVHSFAARPSDPDTILATTEYGERFATIVGRGPVLGVQFHPEKSSHDGLRLLHSFARLCANGAAGSARAAA
ncbi:MAG: imidazole glycerol phosphate synthase subunit HisH [Solirubrobacteraceae bacterium]